MSGSPTGTSFGSTSRSRPKSFSSRSRQARRFSWSGSSRRVNSTPGGEWLEQERDEWVVLLDGDAELVYDDGAMLRLDTGDHVLIPAMVRHRVEWTRADLPCVWLAVYADDLSRPGVAHE
ncbi:MAG: cupin domain-containing protein [Gaiellaceae bacterium]